MGAVPVVGSSRPRRLVDREYLDYGLTGMGRACDRPGWFQAHWGAAVLASYFLRRDADLNAAVDTSVKTQADLLVDVRDSYFVPLKGEDPDPKLIETVAGALEGPITGYRAHGHHVIFASLALRALEEAPHMATPALTRGLSKITERIGKKAAAPDPPYNRENPLPAYTDEASIANALFDCLLRWEGVRFAQEGEKGLVRPNFTHQITYTDALIQLHRMGRDELARRGHAAHQIAINTAPPEGTAGKEEPHPLATLDVVLSPDYWQDEQNCDAWKGRFDSATNRMGDWVVGHLFKILYSYLRVRNLIADREKATRVDRIVLERYVDPLASGG
jgi:hypothetical protein